MQHLLSTIYYPLSTICRHRRLGPPSTICRFDGRSRRSGFTLIELLVVIAVISILALLVTGASQKALGLARARRVEVSRQVLETAILRYRTDYNEWPDDLKHGSTSDDKSYTYSGEANKYAFSPLRQKNNSKGIRYIDETTFLTKDGGGFRKLSEVSASSDVPFVYRSRNGNIYYFTVTINADDDIASVGKDPDDKED